MANLNVTEYAGLYAVSGGTGQIPRNPPTAVQNLAIGVASVQSAAFNPGTTLVRVHTDAICAIQFGGNPTAVAYTGSQRLAANQTEFFAVPAGTKIAVISGT